jgi:diguanylate cyclase (GGDEF)-like protein
MTTVQDFFDEKVRLPSPPAIALKILEAVRQEENSFDDLAQIIKSDPSLSVRILRVANSSLYGLSQPVDSLAQATALMGTDALKNIALSFVIVQEFQNAPQGSFHLDRFWRRAITAAVAADVLGDAVGHKNQDLFVSGLLQDIGVLILFLSHPDGYRAVLDEKRVSGESICATEREQFACDHAEVGHYLLNSWNLPESISQPIRYHHDAAEAEECYRDLAMLLGFADKISAMYHSVHSNRKSIEVHSGLAEKWQISGERSADIIDTIGEKSREIMDLFAIDPGEIKPFSQIMQEANEELGELNLSYEQVVLELKQAQQNAEQLAVELQQANNTLRELAYRDGLTGLYNHRYFQKVFEAELQRAVRYNHSVSLLMVDIDFFKKVNDTFGHPVGDEVLKELSRVLVRLVRSCDVVARYGGEEFAVVLPETCTRGAKVLAQRLRRGVEQLKIENTNGESFSVTISIGLAATDMSEKELSRVALIECGDQALYMAKQNGRNRVELGVV